MFLFSTNIIKAAYEIAESEAAAVQDLAGVDQGQEEIAYHHQQRHQQVAGSAAAGVALPQQAVAVATGGTGSLPSTIDITDASGEVVQRLVLPEDLQLEPGQTLFLIEGEDGQPQLAVMNQAGESPRLLCVI